MDLAHDRAYRARGLEVPDVAPRQDREGRRRRDLRLRPLRAEREPTREGGFVFAWRVRLEKRLQSASVRGARVTDAVRVRRARAEAAQGGEVHVPHQLLVAAVHERAGYARSVEGRAVVEQPVLHDRGFGFPERHIPDDHAVVVAPEREVHALGEGEEAVTAAVA